MRIRFETTMEDLIALHRFHYANSPASQRGRLIATLVVPAIVGFYALVGFTNSESPAILLAVPIVSIPWVFLARWYLPWRMEQAVRKLLAEGSNRTVLGWREMELTNNRLIIQTELIHCRYDLRAIDKIVADDKYTFVYVTSTQAFIIPMQLYPEEEYRQFVAELREAWEDRDAPRPAEEPDEPVRPADARIAEKPL